MAAIKRIKWRLKGFGELRTSPEVYAELRRRSNAIAESAGEGYEVAIGQGGKGLGKRARAAVHTTDVESIRDNAETNALLRALGSHLGD